MPGARHGCLGAWWVHGCMGAWGVHGCLGGAWVHGGCMGAWCPAEAVQVVVGCGKGGEPRRAPMDMQLKGATGWVQRRPVCGHVAVGACGAKDARGVCLRGRVWR